MGDLLQKEMLGDLAINVVNILILFFVTRALLYKPVKKFLETRREKERKALADAEKAKADAEALRTEYEAALSGVESEKAEILSSARAEARQAALAIRSEADRGAERIRREAEAQAENTLKKAVEDARREAGDLAIDLSAKVLGREVTDEDNRAIIDSFFRHLEEEA